MCNAAAGSGVLSTQCLGQGGGRGEQDRQAGYGPQQLLGHPDTIPCLQNISPASPRVSQGSVTSPLCPGPARPSGGCLAMKLASLGTAMSLVVAS